MSVRRLVASSSCLGRAVSDGWVTSRSGGGSFGAISERSISDVHQYMLSMERGSPHNSQCVPGSFPGETAFALSSPARRFTLLPTAG